MRKKADKVYEIEVLASQSLKDVDRRPALPCSRAAARIRLKMRRVAFLDRSLTAEASAIANEASLLYGADRDAARRYPGGQQGRKSDLAKRLESLKEHAIAELNRGRGVSLV